MMRIAYVSTDAGVPVFGRKGCSIHAQEVLRALVRQRAQVDLFTTNPGGEPPAGLETVCIHSLPRPVGASPADREQAAIAGNATLRSELEQMPRFDFIYERYALWSFAAMEFARDTGRPGLLEVNAPLIEEQAEYRVLVDRKAAESVAQRVFAAASVLVPVSDEIGTYLERFTGTREKICTIPNGMRAERFPENLKAALPRTPGVFTVGFLGTLKAWHGLSVLFEAFAKLATHNQKTRLLIVGDGPEREKLAAYAAESRLADAVHFVGAVAPDEVPGWLASMDVAVAPYPKLAHFYFSPLKVYEYMAAGLPVVASQIGQLEKIIESEVNGLLVPPGDVSALAAALERLQLDPELRRRLGCAGRTLVLNNYTWDSVARRILRLAGLEKPSRPLESTSALV